MIFVVMALYSTLDLQRKQDQPWHQTAIPGGFTVFPPDMLRYDRAFVKADRPGFTLMVTFKTQHGISKGLPTDGRWRSFGIKLDHISDLTTDQINHVIAEAEMWVTFIRDPRGSDLIPKTLQHYLSGALEP